MLGVELNRRQRVLDFVCDLPRHLGPRFERCVRSSSPRWRCRSAAMLLNASTSRRSSSDEVAAMRASRSPRAMRLRARQAIDWIGDSLCHRVAEASAGEDEEQAASSARRSSVSS